MKHHIIIAILLLPFLGMGQIAVGQWRSHLPLNKAEKLTVAGSKVYVASESGIFIYDREQGTLETLSKSDGLSDVGITEIKYYEERQILFIGYENGNIDLIKDKVITNVNDIKRKQLNGGKAILSVFFKENIIYIGTDFGIVLYNIDKNEIKDTYHIGNGGNSTHVYDLEFQEPYIYAATSEGVFRGDITNTFLIDYNNWEELTSSSYTNKSWLYDAKFNDLCYTEGKLIANYYDEINTTQNDSIYIFENNTWTFLYSDGTESRHESIEARDSLIIVTAFYGAALISTNGFKVAGYGAYSCQGNSVGVRAKHAIINDDGTMYFADYESGLVINHNVWYFDCPIAPNGPESSGCFDISTAGDNVYVAEGSMNNSWNNLWHPAQIYKFKDNRWSTFNKKANPNLNGIFDVVTVEADPDNPDIVYAGSWGGGLIKLNNGSIETVYNANNTILESVYENSSNVRIGGIVIDGDKNLYVTSSLVGKAINVLTAEGEWVAYNYAATLGGKIELGDIIVTQNNHKWAILPRGKGLLVFDDKKTFNTTEDDDVLKLSVKESNTGKYLNDIFSIAEDRDGSIWVGTNKGPVVYYDPQNVFDESISAQFVIIELDGHTQYMLENEKITAIAVNGANQKWFGTEGGGVFLMNEDGTEQILHFNTENSPLLSDNIISIDINGETGEVFFGTEKGIVSYKGTASEPDDYFREVYTYPNPVKPDYEGPIVIKGLLENTNVKITDISGNLVYETISEGGQAIWYGKNFDGRKVNTGVYLAFCTNDDGSETHITKIMVLK